MRQVLHSNKTKSNPERNTCIIIDGIDQEIFRRLDNKILSYTGVLNHGRGQLGTLIHMTVT